MSINQAEAIAITRSRLGGDVISLGITDTTIARNINSALRLYSRHQPKRVFTTFDVTDGGITLPPTTLGVSNVFPACLSGVAPDFNIFDPLEVIHSNGSNTQRLPHYLEKIQQHQSNKAFVGTKDWKWDSGRKKLYLTKEFGTQVTVESLERFQDIDEMEEDDLEWVLDYVTALCMAAEGRIRRKFTNDFLQMDGSEMVSEGTELARDLKERLESRSLLNFGGVA